MCDPVSEPETCFSVICTNVSCSLVSRLYLLDGWLCWAVDGRRMRNRSRCLGDLIKRHTTHNNITHTATVSAAPVAMVTFTAKIFTLPAERKNCGKSTEAAEAANGKQQAKCMKSWSGTSQKQVAGEMGSDSSLG